VKTASNLRVWILHEAKISTAVPVCKIWNNNVVDTIPNLLTWEYHHSEDGKVRNEGTVRHTSPVLGPTSINIKVMKPEIKSQRQDFRPQLYTNKIFSSPSSRMRRI